MAVKANEKREKDNCTVFVRGLPFSATNTEVTEFFSHVAPVKHAIIVTNPETHASKGYAFITFPSPEDAALAMKQRERKLFQGRKLLFDLAERRDRERHGGKRKASSTEQEPPQKKSRPEKKLPKLIIRNLPWSVRSPEELEAVFKKYGKVKNVVIPRGPHQRMTGFAFAEMESIKGAQKAIKGINGIDIGGRTVAVDWALSKSTFQQQAEDEQQKVAAEDRIENVMENGLEMADDTDEAENFGDDSHSGSSADEDENEPNSGHQSSDVDDMIDEDIEDDDVNQDEDEDDEEDDIEDRDDDEGDYIEKEILPTTLFVRNLPFSAADDDLHSRFRSFGPLRYARVVTDHATGRSKGTGFIQFIDPEDAKRCVSEAPKSTLEGDDERYMMEGRTLSVVTAVNREEAAERMEAGQRKKAGDARNLFLLNEAPVEASGKEEEIRSRSISQRRALLQKNPSLHVSLYRLSIRNLPRSVDAKQMKALARSSVVEFAKEVREGKRQPLTKDEKNRDRQNEQGAIVKQAKVVHEKDNNRSRGYGFIQYSSHRLALMGIRWLNGRKIETKRIIAEFAIENIPLVQRRSEREQQSKKRGQELKRAHEEESKVKAAAAKEEEALKAKQTLAGTNPKAVRMIAKKRKARKGKGKN